MDPIKVISHRHVVARPGEGFAALGAVWTPLQLNPDARGWFAEIWKSDPLQNIVPKQISISKTLPGVTKAFHFHKKQEDLFIPISGSFRIVLLQTRSPFEGLSIWWKEGSEGALRIPAGLAHGYRVEGAFDSKMLYLTSETYSPDDEGRLHWDCDIEGFPWDERPEAVL